MTLEEFQTIASNLFGYQASSCSDITQLDLSTSEAWVNARYGCGCESPCSSCSCCSSEKIDQIIVYRALITLEYDPDQTDNNIDKMTIDYAESLCCSMKSKSFDY